MTKAIQVEGTHCGNWCTHSMCDLKAALMNMHHSLIQELMLYEFELGNNTVEATKKMCKS